MNKSIWALFSCLLIALTINGQSFESAIQFAEKRVAEVMDSQKLPGVAVCVFARGQIWSEGFGYSDLESRAPVIPEFSRFRIGSISKTLTAAALARLYEQGVLDPMQGLDKYYPDFPDKGYRISIKQLAGHLAGIRHYNGNEFLNTKRYANVREGLSIFEDSPLLFAPGSKYSYSSYGYNLLSATIEEITNEPFLEYINKEVFANLEMSHTVADYHEKITPGRVRFYELQNNQVINCPFVDNSYKWAGGGFLSTAYDLMKFARAHLDHEFVSKETFEMFTTSQKLESGEETGYGMGWRTANDKYGRHWVGHSGGSVGGTSMMMLYPREEVIVILLTNFSQANIGNLTSEIANAFTF